MKTSTVLNLTLLAALALAAPARAEEKTVFSTDSRMEVSSAPAQDKQAAPAAKASGQTAGHDAAAAQDHAEAGVAAGKEDKPAGTAVTAPKAGAPAAGTPPAAEKAAAQNAGETAGAALKSGSRAIAKTAYFEPRSLINY